MREERRSRVWINVDYAGKSIKHHSKRITSRVNERSLQRDKLRRRLCDLSTRLFPPPSELPHVEVNVYTDGASTVKRGCHKDGCEVWFANNHGFNINTKPTVMHITNRVNLIAIILIDLEEISSLFDLLSQGDRLQR